MSPLALEMDFIDCLLDERYCWITGHFRTHKTALAYAIAMHLASKGLVSNISSNIEDVFPDCLDEAPKDACIILDEPGRFLLKVSQARIINSFAGKLGLVFLFPGKQPPHADLRQLVVKPLFDGGKLGMNWILYGFEAYQQRQKTYDGKFLWINQAEVYGLYNSEARPSGGGQIWDTLQKYYGLERTGDVGIINAIDGLADELSTLANYPTDVSQKRGRKGII